MQHAMNPQVVHKLSSGVLSIQHPCGASSEQLSAHADMNGAATAMS